MIAANCSMPNMPRLDMVKVPLSKSVGFSLLSRAYTINAQYILDFDICRDSPAFQFMW